MLVGQLVVGSKKAFSTISSLIISAVHVHDSQNMDSTTIVKISLFIASLAREKLQ